MDLAYIESSESASGPVPHEISGLDNIAADPASEEALVACRERLRVWMEETRDPTRVAFRDLILQPA